MRTLISICSLLFVVQSEACLNLTGNLAGSCIYRSEVFGELSGSIEFHIQQATCNEITVDGATLNIPGQVKQQATEGTVVDTVNLAMDWQSESQDILNFQYQRNISEKGQTLDEMSLDGFFKQEGSKIVLQQTGLVDQDPVEIYCEMYK